MIEMIIATGVKANQFKATDTMTQVLAKIQTLPLDEEDSMMMQATLLKDLKRNGLTKESTVTDYLKAESKVIDEALDKTIEELEKFKKKPPLEKVLSIRAKNFSPSACEGCEE
jgi:hypothetical protein